MITKELIQKTKNAILNDMQDEAINRWQRNEMVVGLLKIERIIKKHFKKLENEKSTA